MNKSTSSNKSPTKASNDRRPAAQLRILHEMLSIPTAPFAEHKVLAHVERFCAARKGVSTSRDRFGNLLARLQVGGRKMARPVCITAHLDHPGFVVDRMVGENRLRAFWRGGVPKEYFVDASVRFDMGNRWLKGRIESIKTVKRDGVERVDTALMEVREKIPSGTIGMWDFPNPAIRGSKIYARACDDLAGASAMLCAIDILSRERKPCDAYFLFTRAEEVGFVGAIAAANAGTIPKKCFVVAMETSSERPFAKIGDGPILRVGDKASTFTHAVTAHCHQVAKDLAKSDKKFTFQRKLMDGGTCESSAYCTLGYDATGICVALGNYHNVDSKRKKLGPEYIDLDDFAGVVKWFVALARSQRAYTGRDEALVEQMAKLEQRYAKLLDGTRELPR
jgi:putative aminopeptidase FrvX